MTKTPFSKIPRIESLHHRLKTAKDPEGKPLPILDELMVLLEDPPPDAGDRWQAGADLCAAHGIATSRMSVWRFYRAHVVEWRRENAPPLGKVSEESTTRLLEQARHLAAVRAVESLHAPNLSPSILVGIVQNENRRQQLLLAREKFNEHLETKRGIEQREIYRAIDNETRDRVLYPFQLESYRKEFELLLQMVSSEKKSTPADAPTAVPPDTAA